MTKVQFSNRQLFNMIVPLFFEQLLIMLVGIAWAMCADWFVRAILFILRLKSGVWKKKRII